MFNEFRKFWVLNNSLLAKKKNKNTYAQQFVCTRILSLEL